MDADFYNQPIGRRSRGSGLVSEDSRNDLFNFAFNSSRSRKKAGARGNKTGDSALTENVTKSTLGRSRTIVTTPEVEDTVEDVKEVKRKKRGRQKRQQPREEKRALGKQKENQLELLGTHEHQLQLVCSVSPDKSQNQVSTPEVKNGKKKPKLLVVSSGSDSESGSPLPPPPQQEVRKKHKKILKESPQKPVPVAVPPSAQNDKPMEDDDNWAGEWDDDDDAFTLPPRPFPVSAHRTTPSSSRKTANDSALIDQIIPPRLQQRIASIHAAENPNLLKPPKISFMERFNYDLISDSKDGSSSGGELLDIEEDVPGIPVISSGEKRSRTEKSVHSDMEDEDEDNDEQEYSSPPKRPSLEPPRRESEVLSTPSSKSSRYLGNSPVASKPKVIAPRLLLQDLPEKTPPPKTPSKSPPVVPGPSKSQENGSEATLKKMPCSNRPMPLSKKRELQQGKGPSTPVPKKLVDCSVLLERCKTPTPAQFVVDLQAEAEQEMEAVFQIDERPDAYRKLANANPSNTLIVPEELTNNAACFMDPSVFNKSEYNLEGQGLEGLVGVRRAGTYLNPDQFGAGYLEIQPKTVLPMEMYPDKNIVYFVLEGQVTVKSAGGWFTRRTGPKINFLVGRKFEAGACIVIRSKTVYSFENWGNERVLLGYAEHFVSSEENSAGNEEGAANAGE